MVHDSQQAYYDAIKASTKGADSGAFIDFMLTEIHETLKVYQREKSADGGVNGGVNDVLKYILINPNSRVNVIAEALQIPVRSVERYLSQLKKDGKIEFRGAPRNGGYFLKEAEK